MSRYLFKNAHVIDPVTGFDDFQDVLIVDGTIERIGQTIHESAAETFDIARNVLAPGFCDMHVHLREPGFEYKETIETGALAAAAGGFTAVACMPNTQPAIDHAEVVHYIRNRASQFPVDVYPIGAITKKREGKELAPLVELFDAGVAAYSDDGAPVSDSQLLRIAFEYSSMLDRAIIQHCEDLSLAAGGSMNEGFTSTLLGLPAIPRIAEDTMVRRDIMIAEYLDCAYHVAHVSTMGAVDAIRYAKGRGLRITSEVAPHHFSLTDEAVTSFDTNTKMNPPLRTKDDVHAIKEGLRDGTIDCIATDHAPHAIHEKDVEYEYAPFGIIGLETAIGLTITEIVQQGYLTIPEMITKLSTNPRTILRLPEIRIEVGQPANLTIFDPHVSWQVDKNQFRSKSKNTPFHGWKLTGKAIGIFNKGQLVWHGV